MIFISNLISGIRLGSIYAIIALGYTMVYGIAKMLNFAHGDVIMIGAYSAFVALYRANLPLPIALIISIIIHCSGSTSAFSLWRHAATCAIRLAIACGMLLFSGVITSGSFWQPLPFCISTHTYI